jgi:hypothetical protein
VARVIAAFFRTTAQQAGWIISIPCALVVIGALVTGWPVYRIGCGLLTVMLCGQPEFSS